MVMQGLCAYISTQINWNPTLIQHTYPLLCNNHQCHILNMREVFRWSEFKLRSIGAISKIDFKVGFYICFVAISLDLYCGLVREVLASYMVELGMDCWRSLELMCICLPFTWGQVNALEIHCLEFNVRVSGPIRPPLCACQSLHYHYITPILFKSCSLGCFFMYFLRWVAFFQNRGSSATPQKLSGYRIHVIDLLPVHAHHYIR